MLLNKHNLNIAKLCSSKQLQQPAYGKVRVTPKETIVTDGHLMARVTTVDLSADSFPVAKESGVEARDDFKPFNLVSTDALKIAKEIPKSPIPVLNCAAVAMDGDETKPKVITTDLERTLMVSGDTATYPDVDRAMPKDADQCLEIGLDPRKVRALMEAFTAFLEPGPKQKNKVIGIRFVFYGKEKAVKMEAVNDCGQVMTALLMPVRV